MNAAVRLLLLFNEVSIGGNIPPVGSFFMITNSGNFMITKSGNLMITKGV